MNSASKPAQERDVYASGVSSTSTGTESSESQAPSAAGQLEAPQAVEADPAPEVAAAEASATTPVETPIENPVEAELTAPASAPETTVAPEAGVEQAVETTANTGPADEGAAIEGTAPEGEATESEGAEDPFRGVVEPLRIALERKGFKALTAVQRAVLDQDGTHRDLRISSQTGSGKTVALGLAMAPTLLEAIEEHGPRGQGPRALVVAPTRELAMQVRDELEWLYRGMRGTKVVCVTGGTNIVREKQALFARPTILVGTPGRLLDHHRSGTLNLDDIRHLVLDEADQMLDLGFRDDLDAILDATPPTRRTHLVSATFPRAVERLADRCQDNAISVEGTALGEANADIDHIVHLVFPGDRLASLINLLLLGDGGRTLIFVRTRMDTTGLSEKLCEAGFAAAPLSGELAQRQRTQTLDAFRSGRITALVATDVAARGLDVQDVTTVVHMDQPFDGEVYTHRSGRTGRAGNKGRSIMLVPVNAERGVRRMLSNTNIRPQWLDLPTAEDVADRLQGRYRMALHSDLDKATDGGINPRQLELAQDLVQGRDPTEVVAVLLERLGGGTTCEPRQVGVPRPRGGRTQERDRRPAGRNDRHDRHDRAAPRHQQTNDRPPHRQPHGQPNRAEPQDRRMDRGERRPPMEPRGGREERPPQPAHSGQQGDFADFSINWGGADGANPKRVLAHICRRGGITSRDVGVIRIFGNESTIQIARNEAASFAQNVKAPDAREPHLVIQPSNGAPPQHGDRGPQNRGAQHHGGQSHGGQHRGYQDRGHQDRGHQGRGYQDRGNQNRGYQGRDNRDRGNQGYRGQGNQDRDYQDRGQRGYQDRGPRPHGRDDQGRGQPHRDEPREDRYGAHGGNQRNSYGGRPARPHAGRNTYGGKPFNPKRSPR